MVVTDRGVPSHVLMTRDAYSRLTGSGNIVDALACPEAAGIEFDPPRLDGVLLKPAEF